MHLGFDVGGTKIFGVAVDDDPAHPTRTSLNVTTPDADIISSRIVEMATYLATEVAAIESLGVGIAGIVNREGELKYSPNIPGVVDFPIRARLQEAFAAPVLVENDATSAVWAETHVGAGRGSDNVALVTLGTGIGTGFVLDGRLHRGWNGFSGESGHMTIDINGEKHLTGARGPWEMYAGGPRLGAMARVAAAGGRLASVLEAVGSVEEIRGEHLATAIAAGDPDAIEILEEFSRLVAVGVAGLVHILDLELIVIGGGLVEVGAPLIDRIQRWTNEYVLGGDHRPRPRVVAAELGSAAGALGAAMLAEERSRDQLPPPLGRARF